MAAGLATVIVAAQLIAGGHSQGAKAAQKADASRSPSTRIVAWS
jgi:hypothetical protein